MKGTHCVAFVLVIIGGLDWGLVAIGNWMGSNWNVVNLLLGSSPTLENIVYLLVGLSAIVIAVGHKKDCRTCGTSGMATPMAPKM
jgi:uncharacterized membrane protein YuzA (DUF378 family)